MARHIGSVFARPFDGVMVVIMLGAVIAMARNSLFTLEPVYQIAVASGMAGLLAPYAYFVARIRLAFFRSDSVLADVALGTKAAWQYMLAVILAVCLGAVAFFFAPDAALTGAFAGSFCLSLIIAWLVARLYALGERRLAMAGQARLAQMLASRHTGAGLTMAATGGALGCAFASAALETTAAIVVVAILALALGLWYSPVCYTRIEFERLIGLSPAATLWLQLKALLVMVAALTLGAAAGLQISAVAAALAAFAFLLLYKGLEILIVRAFGGNRTQMLMALMLFVLLSAALVFPVAIAILAPVIVIWLFRTASRRTWQLL